MTTWQPIETAPTDGREIILARFVDGAVRDIDVGKWEEYAGRDDPGGYNPPYSDWVSDRGIEEPTHWASLNETDEPPIPMVLFCPACTAQHVDAPQPEKNWTNPPHRSHECQFCGHVWRPADVPTTGVESVLTRGKADTPEKLKSRSAAMAAFLRYMDTDPKDRVPVCHGDGAGAERLHFLKAGHVLTDDDVRDIQNVLDDFDDEIQQSAELFHDARLQVLNDLGGEELVAAVEKHDSDKIHLIVQQALSRHRDSTDDPLTAARRAFLKLVKSSDEWSCLTYDSAELRIGAESARQSTRAHARYQLSAMRVHWRALARDLGIRMAIDEDTKAAIDRAVVELE